MTGVMRRFSAALAAAAMAVSIVPFADISAYAEYAATHPEGFVYACLLYTSPSPRDS